MALAKLVSTVAADAGRPVEVESLWPVEVEPANAGSDILNGIHIED